GDALTTSSSDRASITALSTRGQLPCPTQPYRTIALTSASAPANASQTVSVSVDGSGPVLLNVLSGAPLAVTLIDPNGRAIDPGVVAGDPAITYVEHQGPVMGSGSGGWWYQY